PVRVPGRSGGCQAARSHLPQDLSGGRAAQGLPERPPARVRSPQKREGSHRGRTVDQPVVRLRITLQQELDRLQSGVQHEGELALRSLRAALNALCSGEMELADEVIRFDDEVDAVYLDLEHGVHALLARQTPVAADLRLVLAILHNNLHLERIADYCVT